MALSLFPLLCNHGKVMTSEKNSYLNEGRFYIGRFIVGSLPRIINREVLAQFINRPASSTKKLFTMKKLANFMLLA